MQELSAEEIIMRLQEQKCMAEDTLERCRVIMDALGHAYDDKVGELRRTKVELIRVVEIVDAQEKQLKANTEQILDLARQIEELRNQKTTLLAVPEQKVSQLKPRKSS